MHRVRVLNIRLSVTTALLTLAALCLLSPVSAQTTGGVKGKVKNMDGNGISQATITARLAGKDIRSTKSNNKGDFVLDGLESGTYNLVFDARGYSSGVKYGVEIKSGKTKDLGGNLILIVDRGTQVIINGSVYYKDGTSLAGAEIKVERVNADGSTRKIASGSTNQSGEFTLRQPEARAKFRITASYKGVSDSKEIEVDNAAIYRFSIILEVEREK